MKVGIIGCGYVMDHYMTTLHRHAGIELVGVTDIDTARAKHVAEFYGLHRFETNADLLADESIELVLNLTSIDSHQGVIRDILEAGKHVYSEKPLTTDLAEAKLLAELAAARGLALSGAPCNALSDTSQTIWKAVLDGAVGSVRLVYAEFDDNPVYLMKPETWRSRTGAPWPYRHEYEQGCTFEHAGYYLSWLVAMFGPVSSLTAYSEQTIPDKCEAQLDPADTPDFSVACLHFASGLTARLTCSIAAPYDQRLRIIGDQGQLSTDTYRHYENPVHLERFTKLSLNARKAKSVRSSGLLQWLFGVGGRRIPLVRRPMGPAGENVAERRASRGRRLFNAFKRRELGWQDKCLGVAEMIRALETGEALPLPTDFVLHVTELTHAMQRAGVSSQTHHCETSCEPLRLSEFARDWPHDYGQPPRRGLIGGAVDRVLERLHSH